MNSASTLVPPSTTALGALTVFPDDDAAPAPSSSLPVQPRFDIHGEIGRGGVGSVVAATDRDIGRKVAIKRMFPQFNRSEGAVGRFVQEARTIGKLDHPNIVPIHDVGRDPDGNYFFVMELLQGETLEAVIERLRAGDRETLRKWT
jgi:serine/threonine-protein kinase